MKKQRKINKALKFLHAAYAAILIVLCMLPFPMTAAADGRQNLIFETLNESTAQIDSRTDNNYTAEYKTEKTPRETQYAPMAPLSSGKITMVPDRSKNSSAITAVSPYILLFISISAIFFAAYVISKTHRQKITRF